MILLMLWLLLLLILLLLLDGSEASRSQLLWQYACQIISFEAPIRSSNSRLILFAPKCVLSWWCQSAGIQVQQIRFFSKANGSRCDLALSTGWICKPDVRGWGPMVLIETAIKMLSNLNTNIKEHWDLHLFNYFMAMFHYKSHEVAFKLSGSPSVPANILNEWRDFVQISSMIYFDLLILKLTWCHGYETLKRSMRSLVLFW